MNTATQNTKNIGAIKLVAIVAFLVGCGYLLLTPQTNAQMSTLFVGLVLIGYLPFVIDTGFPKFVEGILLGALLGIPVAATFNFWPIAMVFVAIGWTVSCLSLRQQDLHTNWNSFRLPVIFAVTALFASIFWVQTLQVNRLKSASSSAVQIERSSFSLSRNCKIIIGVNSNGEWVLGDSTTSNHRVAVDFLTQNIDMLLSAGIKPDNLSIVGVTPHDIRDEQKIWMLREAFDNVRGVELPVMFEKENPPQ